MKRILTILGLMIIGYSAMGQKTVIIKYAESLKLAIIDGRKAQKLIDSVWLIQENTHIRCDSAYFFQDTNSAKAFGHVTIIDEMEGLDLKGDYLEYDGNTRIARVRDHVIFKDDSADLFTNYLDFDRNSQIGYYSNGGKLVDSLNVLTSQRGYYNSKTKDVQFIDSVYLDSPDIKIYTDTLSYSTLTKVVNARGNTRGYGVDGDTLLTKVGLTHDTQSKYSEVYYGQINTKEYKIMADSLFSNDSTKYYRAEFNIKMKSKNDSLTILVTTWNTTKMKEELLFLAIHI